MSNVLPPSAQKNVWAMYRSRFILVTSLALLGLAIFAAITLVPSYVAVVSAEAGEPDVSQAAQEDQEIESSLNYTQALIQELQTGMTQATSSALDVAISALETRPSGVQIRRITYTRGDEESRLTFSGSASREQVSAYRDLLTKSGLFSGVAVPVGALVGSDGGGFSIVMQGMF